MKLNTAKITFMETFSLYFANIHPIHDGPFEDSSRIEGKKTIPSILQ